jgi:lariat debranching enzyme
MRIMVVGDVHGEFERLAELSARHAPLDAILAVGDVEANRDDTDAAGVHSPAKYRRTGQFPFVLEGLLDLGAPLYFIGGNHEPWPALDAAGPGPWGGGAHFLGRAGVADVLGLRVAYLSGIHSPRLTDRPRARRESVKDRTYYLADEVAQVRRAAGKGVDVLLTHDWPAGITGPFRGRPVGRPELRALCERIRPRWYFCGHMHHRHTATIGPTGVVCLAHIRDGAAAAVVLDRQTLELVDSLQ